MIVKICVFIMKAVLNLIYMFMKLLPVDRKKIVFCSRQGNSAGLDFMMLRDELEKRDSDIRCVFICRSIGHGMKDYLKFAEMTLKSMHHMATSRVCILDSYWPAVSLLKHRKDFRVIQIWHAMGKIKQSGHQSLGRKSGRNAGYAKALRMHGNYDYVIAGGEYWNRYYCASFDITEDKLRNYGLPRIDYLLNTAEDNRKRFFEEFPELKDKKIVLYAPTFRRNMESRWSDILGEFGNDDYVLIVKSHPIESIEFKDGNNVYYMDGWKSADLIAVCDHFITDYSAIALEAEVLRKKIYFWAYDYEEYIENNGLNIDLRKDMSPYVFDDIKDLMDTVRSGEYDEGFIDRYVEKYLPAELGTSTAKITGLIMDIIGKGKNV